MKHLIASPTRKFRIFYTRYNVNIIQNAFHHLDKIVREEYISVNHIIQIQPI
jgi:hypothetical protein